MVKQEKIKYIVIRQYNNIRKGTDAFANLVKKDNDNNKIDIIQSKVDISFKACYNKNDFRNNCVVPITQKRE